MPNLRISQAVQFKICGPTGRQIEFLSQFFGWSNHQRAVRYHRLCLYKGCCCARLAYSAPHPLTCLLLLLRHLGSSLAAARLQGLLLGQVYSTLHPSICLLLHSLPTGPASLKPGRCPSSPRLCDHTTPPAGAPSSRQHQPHTSSSSNQRRQQQQQ